MPTVTGRGGLAAHPLQRGTIVDPAPADQPHHDSGIRVTVVFLRTQLLEPGKGIRPDSAAKGRIAELVRSGAMRPFGMGPLRRARELEAMGFLHIAIQQPLELNWQSSIKMRP